MSDKPSNYDLDDELLSAYLDGELSADERAAVEARLATDPAAQQLLHELRLVSQSVQALPTESLGRDLSEDIIRRAREAKPAQAASATTKTSTVEDRSRPRDTMPKITIFNSRRAWIWASMALAAGLLIMIVQSGDDREKKLPPIAARNQEGAQIQPADEVGQPARREISVSDASKPTSPSPATVAVDDGVYETKVDALGTAMPAAEKPGEGGSGRSSGVTRNGAAAGPPVAAASPAPALQKEREEIMLEAGDASSTRTAAPGQAFDKRTDSPQPTGGLSASGGSQVIAAEKQKKSESIAIPNAQQFVVVRVVAKPDALKNGSFERLLADNKLEFVPQPAQNGPRSFSGGKLPTTLQSALKDQVSNNVERRAVDMVLVEAPAPVVESCLAQLNKNENDFLSIAVSEEPQSHDRFDAKSTPAKKLAVTSKNLSHFSRGTAPPVQEETIDLRKWYYDFNKSSEFAPKGSPRAGGLGGEASATSGVEQDANGDKKLSYHLQLGSEVRRARRIETWGVNNRQAGEPASPELSSPKPPVGRAAGSQSGAKTPSQSMSQRPSNEQAEAKADSNDNDLKVLFVFTAAEAPTPSAPPDNRPK